MHISKFKVKFFILFSTLFYISTLMGQIKIVIDEGQMADYKIAVSPVVKDGTDTSSELSKTLTKTIVTDLEMTGFFNVLNQKAYLEDAKVSFDNVDFKKWMDIGSQGLIKGKVSGKEPLELDLIFYDVPKGKTVLHKKYSSTQKSIRRGVHSFVKELVYLLTGEKLKFLSSKICFVEKTGKTYHLVTTDFDGTNKNIHFSTDKIILLPSWSTNGTEIFFTSYTRGTPYLYSIETESGKTTLISSFPGLNTSATSSPDGKNIALRLSKDGNAEIYLMSLSTKELKRLTKNLAIDTAPSFSPDGKELAFVSDRSGNPHIYRLFVNNPSHVERLTVQGTYNQDPDYSPDGKLIAFTGRDEKYQFDVFLFDVQQRSISRVTQNQGKNETPSFSPDSKLMVFSSNRKGTTSIYVSNIKGDKQMMIYKGDGEAVTPCWSPELSGK